MKTLIKKVIFYDKLYPLIKSSFVYHSWKKANGILANTLNNEPSKDFFVIGVTGSNGKTTTVNLLHKMLNEQLAKTVMVSTANIKIWEKEIHNDKKMTSLDIFDLQKLLARSRSEWCKVAVLEVSSHGIDQQRFEGINFDYALLTNITRDHLDYHGDMHNYAKTKEQLFTWVLRNNKRNKFASFNIDDKTGKKWYNETAIDKRIDFSVTMNSTLKAENIRESLTGTQFTIKYLGKPFEVNSPLLGTHNVYNFLSALSVWLNIGLDIEKCIKSLEGFDKVAGRLDKTEYKGATYFVDFAHSPDALDKTLEYISHIKPEKWRIITVFGAPGNRDQGKRPEMGTLAHKRSDITIVTDDDADTENRLNIIKQVVEEIAHDSDAILKHDNSGENEKVSSDIPWSMFWANEIGTSNQAKDKNKELYIIPERKFAIKFAAELAKEWDIVLIAGKGHETIQLTNYGRRKRSDKKILHYYLSKK